MTTTTKTDGSHWRVRTTNGQEAVEIQDEGLFDELVIGKWFHLERLNDHEWCIRVGDARLLVEPRGEMRAKVDIERGFYLPPL